MSLTYSIIPLLTGPENYKQWAFAMQYSLLYEELWDSVVGHEKDVKKDVKARAKIVLAIDPKLYEHVYKAKTAAAMWDNLKEVHKTYNANETEDYASDNNSNDHDVSDNEAMDAAALCQVNLTELPVSSSTAQQNVPAIKEFCFETLEQLIKFEKQLKEDKDLKERIVST